ncbi:MAG TPA: aldo/keto reductase [Verrucomicrobiales bacterium]|nr:aldo/keto reductase [Verrucomicrobiales bacterium]
MIGRLQAPPATSGAIILPQRQLTRSGEKVTALCLGGYHLGFTENPNEAEKMLERAMELGVRFFDNGRKYHDGRSEDYMGKFLTPKYREQIFLMTKAPGKTGKEVRQQLDDSLRTLKTDHVDLWQIHALQTPKDVDQRLKEGVLDAFLEAREKGKTRYLGFTGHRNPITHLHFLSRLEALGIELDTCQMPLNVCDPTFESFQHKVLPVLLKKKYGVIAMKTMAGGSMMGGRIDTTPKDIRTKDIPDVVNKTELSHANLHQYVYSLPVSTLCTGCRLTSELEVNAEVLTKLKKLSESDMKRLEHYAEPYAGLIVENYKRILK